MLKEFLKYIEENRLLKENDSVLLAVSGGIDSMVMADLFIRAGISAGIAHCNFSLRGAEADKDEELVKKFAASNGIRFFSVRFDTRAYAKKQGISIQMAARDLRYEWFEKIRKTHGFDSVAIAHNLNDNIETFLINLTRGTGISGLSGMQKSRKRVIRPLLFATRQSIENYCSENNIIYREDRSNAETKYMRNKIRHLVLPLLADINPSIEFTLNDTTERLRDINEIFNSYTETLKKKIFREIGLNLTADTGRIEPYIENNALLFELFRPYGLRSGTVTDLRNIIRGQTGSEINTGTHRIIKNREELIITPVSEKNDKTYICKNVNELRECSGIASVRELNITKKFRFPSSPHIAVIDREKISFPLIIRNWEHGDHFFPLGMKHKKKLSDYFIDKKISVPLKESIKVLESSGCIVWIIGERIDDRFRVTDKTTKVLIIKAKSPETKN